ncbi:MAG: tetratricopeptide repeat protein [Alphaproteobacteria bacterium]|nr:MAG: tetratricopeptide repeat protein [Alphaproteobacteria bacterium]
MRKTLSLCLILLLMACAQTSEGDKEAEAVDKSTFLKLAEKAYSSHDLLMAASMYQKAISADPELIPARLGYARTLAEMGNIPFAIDAYEQVIKLRPNDSTAKRGLAGLYLNSFKAKEAETLLVDALNQKPEPKLFNSLGVAYDMMGEADDARQAYYSGLVLDNKDQNLWANLGLSLALNGRAKEGVKIMQKVANSANANPVYRQNLAFLYILTGQKPVAEKILRLDMSAEEVDKITSFYTRVAAMEDSGDKIKALVRGMR